MKILKLLTIIFISFLLTSCEEDQSEVFKAQECLNNLGPAQTAEAANCYNIVAGVSGQQAASVRCAAKLLEGGLTDARYATAFQYFDDNETGASESNKEAYLMSLLALTPSSLTTIVQKECQSSGLSGQALISGLATAGTVLKDLLGFDPSDPGSINSTTLDAQLTTCANDPSLCDEAEIETAVSAISNVYCKGENATEEICTDITSAAQSGTVAESFFCAIQDKVYNSGSDTCVAAP